MKYNLVKANCVGLISSRYNQIIIVIVLVWPVLLSYVLYPDTFGFSWNAGRGGFLIATVLTLIEILGSRPVIRGRESTMLITFAILIQLIFLQSIFRLFTYTFRYGKFGRSANK